MKEETILSVHGLSVSYQRKHNAVSNVSLTLAKGEIMGLLGVNGAGKSTLLKAISSILPVATGSIQVFGKDLAHERTEILKRTGTLIESPSLYPFLTGRENLRIRQRIIQCPVNEIDRVLSLVDMAKDAAKKTGEYSTGMKQRLGIAMALLGSPEFVILDEPLNGLDPYGIRMFRELVRDLSGKGCAVIISSHLLSELEQSCHSVAFMFKGELIYRGSITSLQESLPRQLVIRVDRCSELAPILVRQCNFVVQIESNTLRGFINHENEIDVIARCIINHDFRLLELRVDATSLEDAFVMLTSQKKLV